VGLAIWGLSDRDLQDYDVHGATMDGNYCQKWPNLLTDRLHREGPYETAGANHVLQR
jgi:hypothetical protein